MELELTWMGLSNEAVSVEGQLLFKEKGISGAWGSGLRKVARAEAMLANSFLKHCLPLKNFHS